MLNRTLPILLGPLEAEDGRGTERELELTPTVAQTVVRSRMGLPKVAGFVEPAEALSRERSAQLVAALCQSQAATEGADPPSPC